MTCASSSMREPPWTAPTSHAVPVFNPSGIPLRERLVYVDTFELT